MSSRLSLEVDIIPIPPPPRPQLLVPCDCDIQGCLKGALQYHNSMSREVKRMPKVTQLRNGMRTRTPKFRTSFLTRKQSPCVCLAPFRITVGYQDLRCGLAISEGRGPSLPPDSNSCP